jgi:hypothetical protein
MPFEKAIPSIRRIYTNFYIEEKIAELKTNSKIEYNPNLISDLKKTYNKND